MKTKEEEYILKKALEAISVAGSQNKLAKSLGVSRQAVGKWAKGKVGDLKASSFVKIIIFLRDN